MVCSFQWLPDKFYTRCATSAKGRTLAKISKSKLCHNIFIRLMTARPFMSHEHHFSSWPFQDAINTAVFTTRQVLEGLCPILEVYHEHDGDWQFLCGTTQDEKDLKLVCLGCMAESDPALVGLADLPRGWSAIRPATNAEWVREPYEKTEGDN